MDLYHSWFYVHILNTKAFVWSVVIFVFTANLLGPIIIWFLFNGRKPWLKLWRKHNKKANFKS